MRRLMDLLKVKRIHSQVGGGHPARANCFGYRVGRPFLSIALIFPDAWWHDHGCAVVPGPPARC
jgi:hypothetical protein